MDKMVLSSSIDLNRSKQGKLIQNGCFRMYPIQNITIPANTRRGTDVLSGIDVSRSCWDHMVKHVKMSSFVDVGISYITNLCYARNLTSRQHESNMTKITFAWVRIPDDAIDIIENYIQMPAGIHVFRLDQAWKHLLDHSNASFFKIKDKKIKSNKT